MSQIDVKLKDYVTWKAFLVVVTIVFGLVSAVFGWLIYNNRGAASDILDAAREVGNQKAAISTIATDVVWIKEKLNDFITRDGTLSITNYGDN